MVCDVLSRDYQFRRALKKSSSIGLGLKLGPANAFTDVAGPCFSSDRR
jgi:hypothetical protein